MNHRWLSNAGWATFGAIVGVTICWLVGVLHWDALFSSEVVAAWVQALGSIAAIAAAASIARSQYRRAEQRRIEERDFRRRVFAFNAHRHIEDWNSALVKALMRLPEFIPVLGPYDGDQQSILLAIERALDAEIFGVLFSAEDLLLLGAGGRALHRAMLQSRLEVRLWASGLRSAFQSGLNFDNLRSEIAKKLNALHMLVRPALQCTQSIIDSEPEDE
jgi:hypothetical protein